MRWIDQLKERDQDEEESNREESRKKHQNNTQVLGEVRRDPHHCVLIRSRIWKGFLIRKRCQSYQLDQRYILWKVHFFALKETFWNHVLLSLTPSKQLIILSKPSQYERGNEDFLIAFTPPMLIRCHGLAYLNFLLLSKKAKKRGGGVKGKMFSLGLCLPSKTNYSPAHACYSWMTGGKKRITADQMGTFHMTKPINHLGGTQVWHSRAATHHFTVYQAQTHGHQSMAPRGPMRTAASPQPSWFMADDFIITHPFSQRRKVMSSLIPSPAMWATTV